MTNTYIHVFAYICTFIFTYIYVCIYICMYIHSNYSLYDMSCGKICKHKEMAAPFDPN